MLSEQDLQRAFKVSFCLHPDRLVAWMVAKDGVRRGELLYNEQQRRRESENPYKQRLSEQNALVSGLFAASEIWERDQESAHPHLYPLYIPTSIDLLRRYIKALVWNCMEHNARWVSVAIGAVLYRTPLTEVARLSPDYFDSLNVRRIKANLQSKLSDRFRSSTIAPTIRRNKIDRTPSEAEFQAVQNILALLAPWSMNHPDACDAGNGLLQTYLSYDSPKSEAQRIHALINPECAGWVRFVDEFNSYAARVNQQLIPNPRKRLRLPITPEDILSGVIDEESLTTALRLPEPAPLNSIELASLRKGQDDIAFEAEDTGFSN